MKCIEKNCEGEMFPFYDGANYRTYWICIKCGKRIHPIGNVDHASLLIDKIPIIKDEDYYKEKEQQPEQKLEKKKRFFK